MADRLLIKAGEKAVEAALNNSQGIPDVFGQSAAYPQL